MDKRFLTPDAGAAAGLIIGIILGSLAVNVLEARSAQHAEQAAVQSAPAAGASPAAGTSSISQR